MKDKRIDIVKKHFDVYFDDQKFKVIACKIDEVEGALFIKTKIFGQAFPRGGHFRIVNPSVKEAKELCIRFYSKSKNEGIENWVYTIIGDCSRSL